MANPVVRALGDAGLGAWFGGTLMGVVGVNRAGRGLADPTERLAFLDAAWERWTVPGGVAIAAHLLGSAADGWDNRRRIAAQRGMGARMLVQGGLSLAAVAATAAARAARRQVVRTAGGVAEDPHAEGISAELARAQRRLRAAECAVPVLTGVLVALDADMSEHQRPVQTVRGAARRLRLRPGGRRRLSL